MPDSQIERASRTARLAAMLADFREPRHDAAKRALALITEVESAVNEIDAMHAELRRLGGHQVDLKAASVLAHLVLPLERIAGESS